MTFTPTDTANYTHRDARSVAITVVKATPTITWPTPAAIAFGTVLSATQLNATASVRGTFVYTPAAGAVLSAGRADAVGDLHADRHGELHRRATTTVSLTVLKGTPDITWPHAGRHHLRHGAGRDAAERDGSVPGTFVYTPAAGTVLTAGAAQTLSVTFTPTDAANYTTATATVVDQRAQGDAGRSPGRRRPTSPTARRWARRS